MLEHLYSNNISPLHCTIHGTELTFAELPFTNDVLVRELWDATKQHCVEDDQWLHLAVR